MILLVAVLTGLIAGLVRSKFNHQPFQTDLPRHLGLLFVTALLQVTTYFIPAARQELPGWVPPVILVGTQIGLLIFVYLNRAQPGFLILGAGLALNLLVITANGGWMPVTPQVMAELYPGAPAAALEPGGRAGWSKDWILLPAETRFLWLSDRLLLPAWFPGRAAFSFGDILISLGAFWTFWARAGKPLQGLEQPLGQEPEDGYFSISK